METRLPPTNSPPPYALAVQRVYSKPLRPIVLFTSSISLIWSLVLGVRFFQDRSEGIDTPRMMVFGLILGILFFVIAGVEFFGMITAITQKIILARIYFVLSGLAAIVTFVAELIRVIAHFLVKSDLISSCMNQVTGAKAQTLSGTIASIDSNEAQKLCEDDWQRGIWWDVGWLVLTTCLALLFAGLSGAYYHQLLDPSFTRTTSSNFSNQPQPSHQTHESYPMGPYLHQDSPFIPPKYAPPSAHPPPEYVADKKFATRMPSVEGLERVSLSDDGPQNRR
ncbi:hypothetical protein DFH28DRAFT_1055728 [Melampsora americana]|nr:hypothetical protein DFH28DRAFT_1055728 [Melampsora americana]